MKKFSITEIRPKQNCHKIQNYRFLPVSSNPKKGIPLDFRHTKKDRSGSASVLRYIFFYHCFLICPGVMPSYRLKLWIMARESRYPVSSAVSLTVFPSFKRAFAWESRVRWISSKMLWPTSARNFRLIAFSDIFHRAAIALTFKLPSA